MKSISNLTFKSLIIKLIFATMITSILSQDVNGVMPIINITNTDINTTNPFNTTTNSTSPAPKSSFNPSTAFPIPSQNITDKTFSSFHSNIIHKQKFNTINSFYQSLILILISKLGSNSSNCISFFYFNRDTSIKISTFSIILVSSLVMLLINIIVCTSGLMLPLMVDSPLIDFGIIFIFMILCIFELYIGVFKYGYLFIKDTKIEIKNNH